jgi:heavy metal sensor kinase
LKLIRHPHFIWLSSIRIRLTLWYIVILLSIQSVFSCGLYVLLVRNLTRGFDAQFSTEVGQIARTYDEQTHQVHWPNQRLNPTLPATESFFIVLNTYGVVQQRSGPLSSNDIAQVQALLPANAGTANTFINYTLSSKQDNKTITTIEYRVTSVLIQRHGQIVATLIAGYPTQVVEQETQVLLLMILALNALVLLVSGIGGYWLVSRALRPVRLITQTVNEISETDLSRRLPLSGNDELTELAATFNHMLSRLETVFERQRRFTADASHELRTPLTIINLVVNRTRAQQRTPEEYEHALRVIQNENEQMKTMVNNLLLLAQADAGQITLAHEQIDLSDIVLEVSERLQPLAHQQHLEFSLGNLPELYVEGDRLYLIHMLSNIVDNAIKYTSGFGDRVYIEIREDAGSGWGTICVQDNGPGIASEHLPLLFDRFFRVDTARSQQSSLSGKPQEPVSHASGLGLSIVLWIVQAHRGEINVESEVGKGTLFKIRLPLLQS